MTVLASRLAARTAARVRRSLIALASPDRLPVATHAEASSATCDTPTTAILVPLTVVTKGAHAAAALIPIPTYGNRAEFAAASVSASAAGPDKRARLVDRQPCERWAEPPELPASPPRDCACPGAGAAA